jgi:hypothetical protein
VLGLEYKQKGLTFVQIREDLAREYGNEKISVPTVVAGEEVVTDSWSIAEWVRTISIWRFTRRIHISLLLAAV